MAESEPKKIRPFGLPDRQTFDADEDPLVELARIVSEDGGFYGARTEKAKPLPRREDNVDRNAFSADLEAELLHELESSFASRSSTPPSRSRAAPQPVFPDPPPDDADNLLRSIEEQLGDFERRARTVRSAPAAEGPAASAEPAWEDMAAAESEDSPAQEPGDEWAPELPPETEEEPRPATPPASVEWIGRPARVMQGRAPSRLVRSASTERRERGADETPTERLGARRRDGAPVERDDLDRQPRVSAIANLRAEAAPKDPPDILRRGRDDRRSPAGIAAVGMQNFGSQAQAREPAQTADADAASVEALLTRELEPSYSDPTFEGRWGDDGYAESAAGDPAVAAATIPPPRMRPAAQRGHANRGLATAAGVLGVVVLGAALAVYLRSGDEVPSEAPPVISADNSAVKVETPQAPADNEGETVGDAVYDSVAGAAPETEEQVVDSSEEPREVARIVLPPSQEDAEEALVRPVGEADAEADTGPRRVRTYVVRPDGTIVEGEAATEAAAPAEEQLAAVAVAVDGEPIEPVPVPTTDINEAGQPEAVAAAPAPSEPAIAAAPEAAPAVAVVEAAPEEEPAEAPLVEMAAGETPEQAAAPQPEAPAEEPVDLLSSAPAQAPPPAESAAAGGFLVQVSSQRSQEQALSSFASMQGRYPAVLGGYQPVIQEADLGEQGIYYRVRVGPWASRAEAVQVCESLQAAGGDCFVTQ